MLDVWDNSLLYDMEADDDDDDDFLGYQAALTYDDLEASGQPVRPLEFPTPVVHDGELVDLVAADHRTGVKYPLKNCLRKKGGSGADCAYLIKKKLAKSTYGWVKLGVVLRRIDYEDEQREGNNNDNGDNDNDCLREKVQWRSTGEFVAVKCSSWAKIQSLRGRHLVDPIKEISVLQLIGNYNACAEHHVMGCHAVFQDDQYLYTVMPYLSGGDLYGKLDIVGVQTCPDEEEARQYFGQLIKALVYLQRRGVCHRNICLENLLLNDKDELVLIDSGLSLRIPYCDPCNADGITDVSEGSTRRLMKPQGQCGKLVYLAPEILEQQPFDGHATDLWAAGITLFITLVGVAPFGIAQCTDKRFEKISHGGLKDLLQSQDVMLSPEAMDLLQNMFWGDPRDRLTLAELRAHPWVLGQRFPVKVEKKAPNIEIEKQRCTMKCAPTTVDDGSEQRVGKAKNDAVEDPATVPTTEPSSRKHRRKLSGARELVGKLKHMMPLPRLSGSSVGKQIPRLSGSSVGGMPIPRLSVSSVGCTTEQKEPDWKERTLVEV